MTSASQRAPGARDGSAGGGHDPGGGPSIARIVVRPLGSPLPLGFFAFAIGTFVFAMYQLEAIPADELQTVALLVLGTAFPLQLISGVLAYVARDTAGGTAITLLACTWLGLGLVLLESSPGQTSEAVGTFTIAIAVAIAIFAVLSFGGKVLLGVAMSVAAPRYLLLGLYELTGDTALQTASGIAGLVVVGIATYGGVALMIEDTAQRTIWPIARRGVSKMSLEGGIDEQLERLGNEPGVRAQL